MKTITDFKKQINIGRKVHTVKYDYKLDSQLHFDLGIREISKVQTNAFALETTRSTGEIVDSWCNFPKKDKVEFHADNPNKITIKDEIFCNGKREILPILTYTILD